MNNVLTPRKTTYHYLPQRQMTNKKFSYSNHFLGLIPKFYIAKNQITIRNQIYQTKNWEHAYVKRVTITTTTESECR